MSPAAEQCLFQCPGGPRLVPRKGGAKTVRARGRLVPSWHAGCPRVRAKWLGFPQRGGSCPFGCQDGTRGVSRSVSSGHVCGVSPAVGQLPVWCLVGTRGVPSWTPRGRLVGVSPDMGSCHLVPSWLAGCPRLVAKWAQGWGFPRYGRSRGVSMSDCGVRSGGVLLLSPASLTLRVDPAGSALSWNKETGVYSDTQVRPHTPTRDWCERDEQTPDETCQVVQLRQTQ